MEGFIVFDFVKEYPAARKQLAQWLAEGKLKRQETVVKGGLKVAEQALVDLFKGGNTGKTQSFFLLQSCVEANSSRKIACRGEVPRREEQTVIAQG